MEMEKIHETAFIFLQKYFCVLGRKYYESSKAAEIVCVMLCPWYTYSFINHTFDFYRKVINWFCHLKNFDILIFTISATNIDVNNHNSQHV